MVALALLARYHKLLAPQGNEPERFAAINITYTEARPPVGHPAAKALHHDEEP